jgi:hypothetical protein
VTVRESRLLYVLINLPILTLAEFIAPVTCLDIECSGHILAQASQLDTNMTRKRDVWAPASHIVNRHRGRSVIAWAKLDFTSASLIMLSEIDGRTKAPSRPPPSHRATF